MFNRELFSKETNHLLDLLESKEWPEAIPEYFICSSEDSDKFNRADGILDHIDYQLADANLDRLFVSYQNKKFLDFGCGEGHVASRASDFFDQSVGYDLEQSGNLIWEKDESYFLTTDFSRVVQKGPFNFVNLFDVLDHSEKPLQVLEQVKSICLPDTVIFVRCHSWMSRHGSHLYKDINKAWVHLFFTEEELKNMGFKVDIKQKIYWPASKQKKWFEESFEIIFNRCHKNKVEPFFQKLELSSRLNEKFKTFPEQQMCQSYNDYILKIK